jgi:phosphopantothenoylcysteine decarboxylase/phosphopantothenate--cysteine ligase
MNKPTRPWIVIASGAALETSLLPYHIVNLIAHYDLDVSVALSPNALEFVTPLALQAITKRHVYVSNTQLDSRTSEPLHLVCARADLVILYPATPRIISQAALGQITCPVTRVFAFTPKPRIIIAPFLHPDLDTQIYEPHLEALRALGCSVLQHDGKSSPWRQVAAGIGAALELSYVERDEFVRFERDI